jgi:hypothetical protein
MLVTLILAAQLFDKQNPTGLDQQLAEMVVSNGLIVRRIPYKSFADCERALRLGRPVQSVGMKRRCELKPPEGAIVVR